ncbi:ABC transporter permease [Spiroplasma clarkii]|uniref:ABC transporter permease n=1 Tax=Spiroplasma clarkii TaxID=2139 RepID=UPI000B568620|nr:ABC transporter permease [Spiroplasma clarkii]ARU91316.1 ABC transporter permease [Spiroplasma clarkii]
MKKQKLFFKNMFKNIIKNQLQLVMVILLMFLSVFVFTLTDSSSQRLTKSRDDFALKSNLHDAVIKFEGSTYNFMETDEFRTITNTELRNEIVLNYLKNSLAKSNSDLKFDFDRTEARNFALSSGKTLKTISLDPDKAVDSFVVSVGMSLATWKEYENSLNDLTRRWVYVSETFAKANDIQINDVIRVNDDAFGTSVKVKDSEKFAVDLTDYENQDINSWITNSLYSSMNWFQVVGYGASANFMAPIIDYTSPLPNNVNEGLVYVNPKNFGWQKNYLEASFSNEIVTKMQEVIDDIKNYKVFNNNTETQALETLRAVSNQDKEVYYSIKFLNDKLNIDQAATQLNDLLTDLNKAQTVGLTSNYKPASDSFGKLVYSINDGDYDYKLRTSMFPMIVLYFRLIMYVSTVVIVLIGVWILIIILKNNIQKTFGQNGVLISLGYKKRELILSNLLYPIFISVIGGIAGYLLALPFQLFVTNIFANFFTINFADPDFSLIGLGTMVFGLFGLLLGITLLTYWIMFSKYSTLQMINYENITTTSNFKIKFKKLLTKRKNFDSRFKGAILSSSISKFVSITSVMLVSSLIVAVGVISPDMLNNYAKYMYIDNEFDNQIEYQTPMYNAPTTFYKTYNPDSGAVLPTASSSKLLEMYLANEISANVYAPKDDIGTLTDLNYKNLNKDFLTNLNLNLDVSGEGLDSAILKGTIISSVWSDYKTYKLDQYTNKQKFLDVIKDEQSLKERLEDIENLRVFYLKYRNTIGLDIRRSEFFKGAQQFDSGNTDLVSNTELADMGIDGANAQPILAKSGRIQKDSIYEKSFYDDLDSGSETWYIFTARDAAALYNWARAFFMDNLQQGFLQGIYVSSPESMRRIMSESFVDDSKQFNALFNVIPYSVVTDDLGVYLDAAVKNVAFKIYGIEADNKTQLLLNNKGTDLKQKLFANKDNIVINSALAKMLKLKVGDEVDIEHFYQALANAGNEIDPYSWNAAELSAKSADGSTNQQELYSRSLLNSQDKGWKNSTIATDRFVYNTEIDTTSETLTKPTVMSEVVNTGDVGKVTASTNKTYKVVGISRQFGTPKAWIQNSVAKTISGYEKSQAVLFQVS